MTNALASVLGAVTMAITVTTNCVDSTVDPKSGNMFRTNFITEASGEPGITNISVRVEISLMRPVVVWQEISRWGEVRPERYSVASDQTLARETNGMLTVRAKGSILSMSEDRPNSIIKTNRP